MEQEKETFEEFKERCRKEYRTLYFDRQGKEINLMDWGKKCEDESYKVLKQEYIDRYFISTVWVGMNMRIFRQQPIQIFETMIFLPDEEENKDADPLYLFQERYSTEEEAFLGHEVALSLVRAQLLIENRLKVLESQEGEIAKDSQ
jgi:hypothetical protein